MEPRLNRWDASKIHNLLSQTATEILKIPLGSTQQSKKWIWVGERHGNYSVKSIYRLLQQDNQLSWGASSNTQSQVPLWKQIWNLKILQKV